MDIKKLKLDKFTNIQVVNFPKSIDPGIKSASKNVEVIIYFIQKIEDVERFINWRMRQAAEGQQDYSGIRERAE